MIHQLEAIHTFDNPVGQLAVTVRRGDKWFNQAEVGDQLELVRQYKNKEDGMITGSLQRGTGVIAFLELMYFRELTAKDIEREHEVSSQAYSGLLESMRRCYGPEFSEDTEVTILGYVRTS